MTILGLCALVLVWGCGGGLSDTQKAQLDGLDAEGVVRAYFSSGDPQVELYLTTPVQRSERAQSNYVADHERKGGVDDLAIHGGDPVDGQTPGAEDYRDQRQFTVEYTAHHAASTGAPPGPRMYFVHVGREPGSGLWKVLGFGTGP
jgi:hypothetical protein